MLLSFAKKIKFQEWPNYSFGLPAFQAHRGYWKKSGAVENTRQAFFEARKNFLMAECDVRLTKDLVPIAYHDEDLSRLNGSDYKVEELTLAQFQELCPDSPTLKELLSSSDYPEFFNFDVKSYSYLGTPLERKICEVVKETYSADRVMFSSFNPLCLWRLQGFLPEVPRAYLLSSDNLQFLPAGLLLKIHMLNVDHNLLQPPQLQELIDHQVPISAWTVNDTDRQQQLLDNGVRSIITDF